MRVLVTKRENVHPNDKGVIKLIDPKVVGYLTKTHALSAQAVDPETQQIKFGTLMRSEVYWLDQRSPAPSLEDPNDLVWLEFAADEIIDETDYNDAEDEDEDEEEESDEETSEAHS